MPAPSVRIEKERTMTSEHVFEITDASFDTQVLAAEVPTLIDFTAAWCGPCRIIARHVAAVAERYAGQLQVGVVDVDTQQALATRYQVRSMPTLLLFKGGRVVGQIVGAVPQSKIEALVAKALG